MSRRKLFFALVLVLPPSTTGAAFAQAQFESSKMSPGVVTQGGGFQSSKFSSGTVMQGGGFQSSKLTAGVVTQNGALQSSKLSAGVVVRMLVGGGSVIRAPLTHW